MRSDEQALNQLQIKELQQEHLICLSEKLAAARNRKDLWNVITTPLLEFFNAKFYTLCLINEDGKSHAPFLYSDEKKIMQRTEESPIIHGGLPIDDGVFQEALESQKPIIFNLRKVMKNPKVPPYVYHWYNNGIEEMMLVKIDIAQETRGMLYLYASEINSFSEEQFDFLKSITNFIGICVSNILANEKNEIQLKSIQELKKQLEKENTILKEEHSEKMYSDMIGNSTAMQEVIQLISQVAKVDSTVLILGETGTGKEVVANAIHKASKRKDKLMVKLNCAALPESLIESELFGHEKGSFTGAIDRRIGKFELANNATIFLDEIGELPLQLQSKLLRVLQEKEIERVGGKKTIPVNVRIIAATNRNLEEDVKAGKFRSDLYYRLHVFPIHLPSLQERREDIGLLANYFLHKFSKLTGKKVEKFAPKAIKILENYNWPGNIRELEHLIERTVLLNQDNIIQDISLPNGAPSKQNNLFASDQIIPLDAMERQYILQVVNHCQGKISGIGGAAEKLGLPGTTLISKMQKLGIKKQIFR
jgi:formate hydrogenlyase transcriptional activator